MIDHLSSLALVKYRRATKKLISEDLNRLDLKPNSPQNENHIRCNVIVKSKSIIITNNKITVHISCKIYSDYDNINRIFNLCYR